MTQAFCHEELLPHEASLMLDQQSLTIALWQGGERVVSQSFTHQEYRLLALFFSRGTAIHCSYDEALAALLQQPVAACQASLQAAHVRDELDELPRYYFLAEMRPVITTLENCKSRLHRLGLHPCALLETGYVMVRYDAEPL